MFRMTQRVYEAMIQDAQKRVPNEGCGLLSGKSETATTFYSMANTEASPVRYFMDPKEQFKVMKAIRSNGEKMLGIYHSHVATQAYPSATDVSLAFYPDVHYVIVSLENRERPVAKAFRIEGEVIQEKPIEVVP